MSKARRYLNDNKADKQLEADLLIIEQIAERHKNDTKVRAVLEGKKDVNGKGNQKRSL